MNKKACKKGGLKTGYIQREEHRKNLEKFKELYNPTTMTFPQIAKLMNVTEFTCIRYAKELGYAHKPRGYKTINDKRRTQKNKRKEEFTTYWKQGYKVKEITKIIGISKETGYKYQRELIKEQQTKTEPQGQ